MLGPLVLDGHLGDHGLHAHAVVVALAVDLLGLRQQRLDALAQLHERVARVGLLDDPGDHLADAVLVLLEHHVALGLADPLEDHLLGGLRGDPAEVGRRDVAARDLVLVLGELLGVDLGLLGLAHLARLGVDRALLLDRLLDELLLELGRQDQLEHAEVRRVAIHVDARVLGGAGSLLVGGEQRVLERAHQLLRGDALLLLEGLDCLDDLLAHFLPPASCLRGGLAIRFERRMRSCGIVTVPHSPASATPRSSAPISSPLKSLRPSIASRVRTRTRRPMKRR